MSDTGRSQSASHSAEDLGQFERFDLSTNEYLASLRQELLRYCTLLCGSIHDAEDIVQIVLEKALPRLQPGYPHANVSAWLRRIARTSLIDHSRSKSRSLPCDPIQLKDCEDLASSSNSVEMCAEAEDALRMLAQRLTPLQQVIFLLCDVFQYTDREAGQRLGMSRGAVKAALHRARTRLAAYSARESESAGRCVVEHGVTEDRDLQTEVLKAYAAAFQAGDITAIVHLCLGGAVDALQATTRVLAHNERRAQHRKQCSVGSGEPQACNRTQTVQYCGNWTARSCRSHLVA